MSSSRSPTPNQGLLTGMALAMLILFAIGCGDDGEYGPPPPLGQPPNIVWIVAEDMNFELGAFGDPVACTPLARCVKDGPPAKR